MKTLGIISYDTNHLKTEQVVLNLIGKYELKVYALPFVQRPIRDVFLQHRPVQTAAVHPKELCDRFGLEFIPVNSDREIDNGCDLYIVTGAGLLSSECLRGKQVLNCHPGVIPAARGLDAFKWSIHDMIPLGVTLHYIDEAVDAGEVISIVPTPVFPSDTLETLARRHYEIEIRMLSDFESYLLHPTNPFCGIPVGESHRRMKREIEENLPERFQQYKERYATSIAVTGEVGIKNTPPSDGIVLISFAFLFAVCFYSERKGGVR